MEKLFGTDGIRGVAGTFPLDEKTVFVLGRSLAKRMSGRLGRPAKLITGRDTRESGQWIETAFHAGAQASGTLCESAGVITTPGVAFLTGRFGFDAGIVISASHNPYQDNGIKIFSPSGQKIESSAEKLLESDIEASLDEAVRVDAAAELNAARQDEFRNSYLDYLSGQFPDLSLPGTKIVIDCANGAACRFAPELFARIGCTVISINDDPNGKNINENCGSLHLDQLQKKVIEAGADIGVAFDGDADRALFVDEKGDLVDGDATLWILAQYFLDHGKLANKTIVATVMSNIGLEIALSGKGIALTRTAVGDKYVLDELISSKAEIGGEQSGHIIIPQKSLVGDGMMTTLFVLEAMFERKQPLSELTRGFVRYPQILVNVKVKQKLPFETVQPIAQASSEIEQELNAKGRLLLRYSGTENLARVMIEGKDQNEIESQAHRLAEVIRAELG